MADRPNLTVFHTDDALRNVMTPEGVEVKSGSTIH